MSNITHSTITGIIVDIIPMRRSIRRAYDVMLNARLPDNSIVEVTCGELHQEVRHDLCDFPQDFIHKEEVEIKVIQRENGNKTYTAISIL